MFLLRFAGLSLESTPPALTDAPKSIVESDLKTVPRPPSAFTLFVRERHKDPLLTGLKTHDKHRLIIDGWRALNRTEIDEWRDRARGVKHDVIPGASASLVETNTELDTESSIEVVSKMRRRRPTRYNPLS